MTGVIPAWTLTNAMQAPLIEEKCDLLFVYGILKRGFSLDLRNYDAQFIDKAEFPGAKIYRIGSGVGLSLSKDITDIVYGEVFRIPHSLWGWLDDIEGHPYNYKREIQHIYCPKACKSKDLVYMDGYINAYVYIHQRPNCFGGQIKSGRYERAAI